jgi:translation elongation factor EF-Tu-like GTPase
MIVVCNKQDIVDRKKVKEGSIGKAGFMKTILDSYIYKLKNVPFFNASALEQWGIQEAIENLVRMIMIKVDNTFFGPVLKDQEKDKKTSFRTSKIIKNGKPKKRKRRDRTAETLNEIEDTLKKIKDKE